MLGILKSIGAATLAAAFLIIGALPAAAQDRAALIGSWNCRIAAPATLDIITTYLPDGAFISYAHATDTSSGRSLEFAVVGEGNWSLVGNVLTETGTSLDIIWVKLDGQVVSPEAQLWTTMVGAMSATLNQPNVRTVEGLTATSLSVDYQGNDLTCTRP